MVTCEDLWPVPPKNLPLVENEVHIWRVSLDAPSSEIQRLRTHLLEDEVQRADRFRFPKDRNHFTIARGVLRILLSGYLDLEPEHIQFEYNQYGKPSLHPVIGPADLKFNLTHSGELALYAFVRRREVGIDIEDTRRRLDQAEDIAKRYFSEYENQIFQSLPENLRREAFFNCWTRKEAYIKARGKGLLLPLDQFDVTLAPGEPARLLATRDDPLGTSHWTMRALNPGPEYIAALVVEGDGWDMQRWQWI